MTRRTHHWIWFALTLPALAILTRYAMDAITYGKVLHETGLWSAGFLVTSLAVSPIRSLFPKAAWVRWLLVQRRAFGVACFGYASLHTLVYVVRKADLDRVITEGMQPDLFTGWLALLLFSALAITSNNISVRMLKNNWKRLHRAVYPAAVLTLVHWVLSAFDYESAIVVACIVLLLQFIRIVDRIRVQHRRRQNTR